MKYNENMDHATGELLDTLSRVNEIEPEKEFSEKREDTCAFLRGLTLVVGSPEQFGLKKVG